MSLNLIFQTTYWECYLVQSIFGLGILDIGNVCDMTIPMKFYYRHLIVPL